MCFSKKNPTPPNDFHIKDLKVETVEQASGLFFDGPHLTNNWESVTKINSGLTLTGSATIQNVRSLVNDSDQTSKTQEKN